MFLAHTNDLRNKTYLPIEQLNKHQILINQGGYKLVSNICPHQGSIISKSAGESDIRVCPYHNWSFELNGTPIASGRTNHYCQNTKALSSVPAYECLGMLFSEPIICEQLNWLDLSNMKLVEYRVDHIKANATSIIDIFLDVDHIETIHAGVYNRLGFGRINEVQWHYYDWGSLQLVRKDEVYGAAWLAVYPETMIEWQEGALFITVCEKLSDTNTKVHVFKYMDITKADDWKLNESVWEESWAQDREQAELLTNANYDNLEESKKHFRQWQKI